jgi:hypothetical protein
MQRRIRTRLLLATLLLLTLTHADSQSVQAQTFTVIHNFTGGKNGAQPQNGVTIDRDGNLYGITAYGGAKGSNCSPTRLRHRLQIEALGIRLDIYAALRFYWRQ